MFQPAKKTMTHLKLAVQGVSGSGKTLSSLILASGLVGDEGKIAVLDTENNSAALYADKIPFDTVNLAAPYTPERYIEIIQAAVKAKYDVIVIDSLTHEWHGQGGILEINQNKAVALKGNTYMAWKEAKAQHQKLVDVILQAPIHVIVTMRQKTEYEQTKDDNGRSVVKRVGLKSMQSPDIEYEFTCVFDLEHDVVMGRKPFSLSKDRTGGIFNDDMHLTFNTGKKLIEWLATCDKSTMVNFSDKNTPLTEFDFMELLERAQLADENTAADVKAECSALKSKMSPAQLQQIAAAIKGNDVFTVKKQEANNE